LGPFVLWMLQQQFINSTRIFCALSLWADSVWHLGDPGQLQTALSTVVASWLQSCAAMMVPPKGGVREGYLDRGFCESWSNLGGSW
jgi:hypothetical protein